MPILMFELSGSALQTAFLVAAETLPYLLLGLPAGVVADRVNRKTVMICSDVAGFLFVASIPLASALGVLAMPQVFVVAVGTATAFVWHDAASFGALSTVATRERLVVARSLMQAVDSSAMIVGPAFAGVLVMALGAPVTLIVDALSFLGSALLLFLISKPFQNGSEGSRSSSFLGDILEGVAYLWRHPIIRALTFIGAGNSFAAGAAIGLLVVFNVRELGSQAELAGLLFAVGAVGSLVASVGLPLLARYAEPTAITRWGLASGAAFLTCFSLSPSFIAASVFYLIWAGACSLTVLNGIIYRQRVVPDVLQGRVNVIAMALLFQSLRFGRSIVGW